MYHSLTKQIYLSLGLYESYHTFPTTNDLVQKVIRWEEYKKSIRNNSGQIYWNTT